MKLTWNTQWGQIYVIPTIRVTHDNFLYGHYNVELWWLKWGIEIIF